MWALGVILYEMLTGQRPFKGESPWVVLAAIAEREPEPPSSLGADIPSDVDGLVSLALEKVKTNRFASASDFANAATACQSTAVLPGAGTPPTGSTPWLKVAAAAVLVLSVAGSLVAWSFTRSARAQWAREEGIPEMMRLMDEGDFTGSYFVAQEVERRIPNDPVLAGLWPNLSMTGSAATSTPDASLYMKKYGAGDDEWQLLGQTPIEGVRLPRDLLEWRVEKAGFESRRLALRSRRILNPNRPLLLAEEGAFPSDMVLVDGGAEPTRITGFNVNEALYLETFLIDRYETTNRDFKEFVDAGGYRTETYWSDLEFIRDGERLRWEEAMEILVDSTGQNGPATWELGAFPDGQGDFPVTGVSWYEAAAYAKFRGKVLPTIYHWARAALSGAPGTYVAPESNFGQEGPASVGYHRGMGPYGTYDTAGNVREWCLNPSGGRRWILGGSWADPDYMFSQPLQLDPFDRSASNGLRLMRHIGDGGLEESLTASVEMRSVDLRTAVPVSDDVFEAFERQYTYPKSALNDSILETDERSDAWIRQEVSVALSYTDERLPIYLFIPKDFDPPYQSVVFVGPRGVGDFATQRSSDAVQPAFLDFVVRSGRVLVVPVYEGAFQRWDGFLDLPTEEYLRAFTDHMVHWREDLGRTLDYLETRPDFDRDRIGYFGNSFGASTAFPPAALEERFKAMVLLSGGLTYRDLAPEADVLNFLPRLTTPVLMLNGEYDSLFPVETLQLPMFDLLGTAPEDKKHLTVPAEHGRLPRGFRIRESVAWLDRYLGPVGAPTGVPNSP